MRIDCSYFGAVELDFLVLASSNFGAAYPKSPDFEPEFLVHVLQLAVHSRVLRTTRKVEADRSILLTLEGGSL